MQDLQIDFFFFFLNQDNPIKHTEFLQVILLSFKANIKVIFTDLEVEVQM